MWLFLEALDAWMFRDGKPFDAGEGHLASSIFSPTAHTIQGSLRSLLLDQLGVDPKKYLDGQASQDVYDLLGKPGDRNNPSGSFWLLGPFVAKRYDNHPDPDQHVRYIPLPQDITADKDADLRFRTTRLKTLHPIGERLWIGGRHLRILDVAPNDEAPTNLWISESTLQQYLDGDELTVGHCIHEHELFEREYRSGNAMDYTVRHVRADEGMLYSGAFIRPVEDVGLLVWVPDCVADKLPDQVCWRIGGEGRSARLTKITDARWVSPQDPLSYGWRSNARLKVVFLTPTYFNQGWLPGDTRFVNALQTAALTHPTCLGGWDLARHRPRPIRRYVPTGSVYYLEFQDDWRPESLLICDSPLDDSRTSTELPLDRLGLGHVAVGTW
ncbi:MAG: type III-B CRISPR module-associated protein Cmr3 [Chloroflexi bacterium]|nr:type III-B CRISPR module-associated protein Cmr3 [Chloroflexota bacterium]